MNYIDLTSWKKRFITPVTRLLTGNKIIPVNNFILPIGAVLHFLPTSEQIIGVDFSYPLIRKLPTIAMYTIKDPEPIVGNVTIKIFDAQQELRKYLKSHPRVKSITNLERVLINSKDPVLINYGLIPKYFKYSANALTLYHEWYNIRNIIWKTINNIGTDKEHFILYRLPDQLPPKVELARYDETFKAAGLNIFHDNESLDILEIWRIISPGIESFGTNISTEVLYRVNLVFSENEQLIVLNLGELVEWCEEEEGQGLITFYHFLDNLLSLRSNIGKIETSDTAEVGENTVIGKMIREQAQAGNLSSAEQKGLLKLADRYKTIKDPKDPSKTLEEVLNTAVKVEVNKEIPFKSEVKTIHDISMLQSALITFEKDYVENLLHRHILQMIMKLHDGGIIVKDVKVNRIVSAVSKKDTYSVSLQPIGGPASTITFTIPVINDEGTFISADVKYRMDKQKSDLPLIKAKTNVCNISSYYGKIFVYRNDSSSHNYAKWITKQILSSSNDEDGNVKDLKYGNSAYTKAPLPRHYSAISETFDSFTIVISEFPIGDAIGEWKCYFNYNKVNSTFTTTPYNARLLEYALKRDFTPVGYDPTSPRFLVMDYVGNIFILYSKDINDRKAGSVVSLGPLVNLINPDVSVNQSEFSEFSILNRRIPIILAFCYLYGIDEALKKLKLPFVEIPTNARIAFNDNEYKLKFKDIVYVIKIKQPKDRLLVGGFNAIKNETVRYRSTDFNKPMIYTNLLNKLGIGVLHLRELRLMNDLFVDPITEELLQKMNYPTKLLDLLLEANKLLINDFIPDVNVSRYKGYERIPGMVYSELINAIRTYRAQGSMPSRGVSMNPKATWLRIIQDESIVLKEESNPIHNDKERSAFTVSGDGGRSTITMVKSARAYTKHDLGTVSEATPDSSKVGIRAYLTADPNIVDLYGNTKPYDNTTDGPSSAISSSLMISAGATNDDAKRGNFISIHFSSAVAADGYVPSPYRTGFEEVLGNRVDKLYVVTAEEDGKVTDIKPDVLTVTYSDGSKKSYELGVYHGIAAGVTVPHTRITDLKVGDIFSKGDSLVYNTGFFQRAELNKNHVVFKSGVLSRIAILESSETIEDGSSISSALAKKLSTPTTKVFGLILDFNQNINNLLPINTAVEPDTILCTISEYMDIDDAKNTEAIKALQSISANSPRAQTYGTITKIEVFYYGSLDKMSPNLKSFCEKADNERAKRINKLNSGEAKTGKIDESIRIGKKKLVANQIGVKIYIDGTLSMESGDKIEFGHMLKSTCSRVITDKMETINGETIDGKFGAQSISDRIVGSPIKGGAISMVMVEATLRMRRNYKP